MKRIAGYIELITNLAIIVVAVVMIVTFAKDRNTPPATVQQQLPPEIAIGQVPEIGSPPSDGSRMLVFALNTHCRYCTESAPLYQRLSKALKRKRDLQLVALFPQPVEQSRAYLKELRIDIGDVRQSGLSTIPVAGTQTLLLLNQSGKVEAKWAGKIEPNQREVFGLD